MPNSAPRFRGKQKLEIAREAFQVIGKGATVQQVDRHFRRYGLPFCERSMYARAKREANGRPVLPRGSYPRYKKNKGSVGLVARCKQLAADCGGWDKLEELIRILK